VTPATDKESKVFREVYNKLKHQKHICIVDQSKANWRAVVVYKKLGIGDNEEYKKKIKMASKEAGDEVAQEKKVESLEKQSRGKALPQQTPLMYYGQQWFPSIGSLLLPAPSPPLPTSHPDSYKLWEAEGPEPRYQYPLKNIIL